MQRAILCAIYIFNHVLHFLLLLLSKVPRYNGPLGKYNYLLLNFFILDLITKCPDLDWKAQLWGSLAHLKWSVKHQSIEHFQNYVTAKAGAIMDTLPLV